MTKTLKDLTPTTARRLVMEFAMFCLSEDCAMNMDAIVADETDGFPLTVTLRQALRAIRDGKAAQS